MSEFRKCVLDLVDLAGHQSDQLNFGHCENTQRNYPLMLVLISGQSPHIHSGGCHYINDCCHQIFF